MARGWESKSIEQQQAEASQQTQSPPRPPISPEQAARLRQLDGLRLSRARILQQLQASQNPRHRQVLEAALADLDHQIQFLAAESK